MFSPNSQQQKDRQPGSKEKPTDHVQVRLRANKLQDTSMWVPMTKPTGACEGLGAVMAVRGGSSRVPRAPDTQTTKRHVPRKKEAPALC